MIHARQDYNGIQDPEGCTSIKEDEPVFLLRAKDKLSVETVRFWANRLKESGGSIEDANSILEFADTMATWQLTNETKIPDTPDGQRWSEREK